MTKLKALTVAAVVALSVGTGAGNAVAGIDWASGVFADPGLYDGSAPNTRSIQGGLSQSDVDTRYNPENALGVPNQIGPDGGPGFDFWSMGVGGWTVFEFIPPTTFIGKTLVIESTGSCDEIDINGLCDENNAHQESANVYAFNDPFAPTSDGTWTGPTGAPAGTFSVGIFDIDLSGVSDLTLLGSIPNGLAQNGISFDLTQSFRYIAIQDTSSSLNASGGHQTRDGFDITGIAVIPVPGTLALLGAGLIGLGFGARRMRT